MRKIDLAEKLSFTFAQPSNLPKCVKRVNNVQFSHAGNSKRKRLQEGRGLNRGKSNLAVQVTFKTGKLIKHQLLIYTPRVLIQYIQYILLGKHSHFQQAPS